MGDERRFVSLLGLVTKGAFLNAEAGMRNKAAKEITTKILVGIIVFAEGGRCRMKLVKDVGVWAMLGRRAVEFWRSWGRSTLKLG